VLKKNQRAIFSIMHLDDERRIYTGENDELVCECLQVERQEIVDAIETAGALTVNKVRRACSAGGGCGSCHEEIARLILSHRFGSELDFQNHLATMMNRKETSLGHSLPQASPAERDRAEFENLLATVINPTLAPLGVKVEIKEYLEELVLAIQGADNELKYTLSFWLAVEFEARYSHTITVIIA
jgi:bacterioferritin-associated ferredoxin